MSQPSANAIPVNHTASRMSAKTLTSLAMLTAISYVVMIFSKGLPQLIGFLQLDLKDTVICIGGFIFGPVAAATISLVVAIVEMFTYSDTGIIGCIMNVLATCSFCCTASYIYKKFHTRKGAVAGLTLAALSMTAVMLLWNYLITPLYMVGTSRADIAHMLVPLFLPFNLIKGGLNMALILVLYKPVVTALRKVHLAPESHGAAAQKGKVSTGFILFSLALLATFGTISLVLMGII